MSAGIPAPVLSPLDVILARDAFRQTRLLKSFQTKQAIQDAYDGKAYKARRGPPGGGDEDDIDFPSGKMRGGALPTKSCGYNDRLRSSRNTVAGMVQSATLASAQAREHVMQSAVDNVSAQYSNAMAKAAADTAAYTSAKEGGVRTLQTYLATAMQGMQAGGSVFGIRQALYLALHLLKEGGLSIPDEQRKIIVSQFSSALQTYSARRDTDAQALNLAYAVRAALSTTPGTRSNVNVFAAAPPGAASGAAPAAGSPSTAAAAAYNPGAGIAGMQGSAPIFNRRVPGAVIALGPSGGVMPGGVSIVGPPAMPTAANAIGAPGPQAPPPGAEAAMVINDDDQDGVAVNNAGGPVNEEDGQRQVVPFRHPAAGGDELAEHAEDVGMMGALAPGQQANAFAGVNLAAQGQIVRRFNENEERPLRRGFAPDLFVDQDDDDPGDNYAHFAQVMNAVDELRHVETLSEQERYEYWRRVQRDLPFTDETTRQIIRDALQLHIEEVVQEQVNAGAATQRDAQAVMARIGFFRPYLAHTGYDMAASQRDAQRGAQPVMARIGYFRPYLQHTGYLAADMESARSESGSNREVNDMVSARSEDDEGGDRVAQRRRRQPLVRFPPAIGRYDAAQPWYNRRAATVRLPGNEFRVINRAQRRPYRGPRAAAATADEDDDDDDEDDDSPDNMAGLQPTAAQRAAQAGADAAPIRPGIGAVDIVARAPPGAARAASASLPTASSWSSAFNAIQSALGATAGPGSNAQAAAEAQRGVGVRFPGPAAGPGASGPQAADPRAAAGPEEDGFTGEMWIEAEPLRSGAVREAALNRTALRAWLADQYRARGDPVPRAVDLDDELADLLHGRYGKTEDPSGKRRFETKKGARATVKRGQGASGGGEEPSRKRKFFQTLEQGALAL